MPKTTTVTAVFAGESHVDPKGFDGTLWGTDAIADQVARFEDETGRAIKSLTEPTPVAAVTPKVCRG